VKLSRHAFVTFWDVHAWGGVLVSLVAYAMFVGGTFSVFYGPLRAWQDPPEVAPDRTQVDAAAMHAAADHGLAGKGLDVWLPGTSRAPRAKIGFVEGDAYRELVVGEDGSLAPTTSRAADVLYQMHILYHEAFPQGFYIAGLVAVAYLLALVTGVLLHLKDLGRQLFRFRRGAGRRALWSDLHKVLGVWGLPFQLMVAFTGAAICLAAIVTPYAAGPAFGDAGRGGTALYGDSAPPPPSGRAGPMLPPSALAAKAEAAVPGLAAWWVRIAPYGDEHAHAIVYGDVEGTLSPQVLVELRARDGAVVKLHEAAAAQQVMSVFTGLHFAVYGGLALRLVYALLGIGGCLTILSGNWIWLARRGAVRPSRGDRLLARLMIGIGGGLPVAIAAMLWANRLLPANAARGAREAWTLFGVLAAVVAVLAIAGAGFAAIPLLSALTRPAHLFNGGGPLGWAVAGVDLGLAVLGAMLAVTAVLLARGAPSNALIARAAVEST
jgi:uncharacterized iron-regulated membrane protein